MKMNKKLLSSIMIALLLVACEGGEKPYKTKPPKKLSGYVYGGNKDACTDVMDDLWCLEPTLQGGMEETLYFRDEEGKMVVLDSNHSKKAIEVYRLQKLKKMEK